MANNIGINQGNGVGLQSQLEALSYMSLTAELLKSSPVVPTTLKVGAEPTAFNVSFHTSDVTRMVVSLRLPYT